MLREGRKPREIAAALGITPAAAYNMSFYLRRSGADVPPAHGHESDDTEGRTRAEARIARDIADGSRCPRCWLLRPCDHG